MTLEQSLAHALMQHREARIAGDDERLAELDLEIHCITWQMDHTSERIVEAAS